MRLQEGFACFCASEASCEVIDMTLNDLDEAGNDLCPDGMLGEPTDECKGEAPFL